MPVEVKELIIKDSLARKEDQGAASTQLLTSEDLERIKAEILKELLSSDLLAKVQQQALKQEILQEVRKMIEDKWRR
ncbi:MAG: hypothetical protein AAF840_01585 [Bacteroidota bacterium]